MTSGQRKVLIFIESAALGAGLGFFLGIAVVLASGSDDVGIATIMIMAPLIAVLWFKSRMNVRIGGLDDLWRAVVGGDETDSSVGYAVAEMEVDENKVDKELWSRALINAKGKEELRKVEYMKLRVVQLKKQALDNK